MIVVSLWMANALLWNIFLRGIFMNFMNKFSIDSGLVGESSSLCEGRTAFRSFSKTVRHYWESRSSYDGMVSQCADSV